MASLLGILHLLCSMFQVRQKSSQTTGADVAAPLCCAQGLSPRGSHEPLNRDGLQRTVDVVTADQANAEALVAATRWKRVVSPNNTSVGVERSSVSSNGVSSTDGTYSIPLCSPATPSANISSSISSTHEAISSPTNPAQLVSTTITSLSNFAPSLFSTCIPQTPFTSTTLTETLITSATFPSSASPIFTCWGLTCLSSSTSTTATSLPPHHSTVTTITLSIVRPRPSPSSTMSNSDTITLAPVNSTPTVIGPGTSQSVSDTTFISSISSTPFVIPTFVSSSTVFSPIPSTSAFLTSITSHYPSISAISLSSISDDDPTITSTSTSAVGQTVTISSVETGALSTNTPQDNGFAHQTGAIIGVAIGGAFFLLIIILGIFFACKRYRSNRSYNSSMEDILAVSRCNTSWRPPLEADDDENYLARSISPNYPKTSGSQGERGPFDDLLSIKGGRSGSAESADANGALLAYRGQPPVAQSLHGSTHSRGPILFPSYSSNDSHGNSRPQWGHTEPLNINKHSSFQKPPLTTIDSHVSAIGRRSASSLGFGGSSSSHGHLGPGSSGETLLPRGNRSTSIPEPRPVHKLSGRRHYSTPPTAFVGRDSSFEYGTQRIQQQHQEEQNQQDRANKSLSQVILARIRASRRLSTASTVKAYSQCTTLESEESTPSRALSYMYSPSLLNPPISMSQTVPPPHGVTRSSYAFPSQSQHLPLRQDASTGRGFRWPDVPPSPSPVPTDTSSMVEGLLHPRLGMALGSSQQASATSLRDHEDYTRPINGLVNNHIRSTTTFETQNTVDLNEGGT